MDVEGRKVWLHDKEMGEIFQVPVTVEIDMWFPTNGIPDSSTTTSLDIQ